MYRVHITQKDGPERSQDVSESMVTLGRVDESNAIVLPRGNVSKQHASLQFLGDSWLLSDLASTNGTFLNTKRISQPSTVWPGDRIHIGDFMLRFELIEAPKPVLQEEPDYDDNSPTGYRHEGVAISPPPVKRLTQVMGAQTFQQQTSPDEAAAEAEPLIEAPTTGLRRDLSQMMLGADTRKASLTLSMVALLARYFGGAGAVALASRYSSRSADRDALASGLASAFEELKRSGEIAANVDGRELLAMAMQELSGLGPLDALFERQDWSYVRGDADGDLLVGVHGGPRTAVTGFSTPASFRAGLARLRQRADGVRRADSGSWSGCLGKVAIVVDDGAGGLSLLIQRTDVELLTLETMAVRQQLSEEGVELVRTLIRGGNNVLWVGEPARLASLGVAALRAGDHPALATLVTSDAPLAASARSFVRVARSMSQTRGTSAGATLIDRPNVRVLRQVLENALLGASGVHLMLPGRSLSDAVGRASLALSLGNVADQSTWHHAFATGFQSFVTLQGDSLTLDSAL